MPHQILIADDDETILQMLGTYLRTLGYEVQTATDGAQALDAALHRSFDLCILDVHLPDIPGSELYMRLRNLQSEIQTIFFTADVDFESDYDFLRFSLPAERVITKPLRDFSQLTRLIISILGPPSVKK